MNNNKNSSVYISLLAVSVVLIFLLIFISEKGNLHLSLPVYFFTLIIFDLAATGFLTGLLKSKSTSEWKGKFMKGDVKLTGPAALFFLILFVGYKYRPTIKDDPFDLSVLLLDPTRMIKEFSNDTLQIVFGNDIRSSVIDEKGSALFLGVDSRYAGSQVSILVRSNRFRISVQADTLIVLPRDYPSVVRLNIVPWIDSVFFSGFVLKRNTGKRSIPIPGAELDFTEFNKKAKTDSMGKFLIYLKARPAYNSSIVISKNQKWIFSGNVPLSENMQILADE